MKPTFIIAGCGKCGTTTLAHLLNQHPDVFVSQPKEPNFLSYDDVYSKGWDWYESLFEQGANKTACGEGSVSYTLKEYESKVSERISKYLPSVRLIYIARNPYKRLESVYREHHNSGHIHNWHLPYTLESAVEYRPEMVTNSFYWQRTDAFRAILPSNQILYLCLEDLQQNPQQVLKRCFEFIQVDSSLVINESSLKLNEGNQKFYDTHLMRFIRTNQIPASIYQSLPKKVHKLSQPLLRKPFADKTIDWQSDFREWFTVQMVNDVQKFLSACGKASNYWGNEFALQDPNVIE